MPLDYLHNHMQFADLLCIIEDETGIQAGLIKDQYIKTSATPIHMEPDLTIKPKIGR